MNPEKLREWIQTAGLVAIPVMVTIMGNAVAKSNATREANAKWVEVGVQALGVNDPSIRQWGKTVLARYSEVPFSVQAESAIARYPVILRPIQSLVAMVVVSPESVTVAPRQQVQFTAYGRTLTGDSVPLSVRWTATRGIVMATGLYKADTLAGDVAVTATALMPSLWARAIVHVRLAPLRQ